jgi:O-antigen ligase
MAVAGAQPWSVSTTPVVVVGVAAVGALGWESVYRPRQAVLAAVALGLVVFVFRHLVGGLVAFTILTFPEHLPGFLGAGATVAKPFGIIIAAAWLCSVVARRGRVRLLLRDHPALSWSVFAFVVVSAASGAWAADLASTEFEVKRLLQVAILLFVVYTAVSTERAFRAIVWAYLGASVLTAGYSLVSSSYGPSGRLSGLFNPNTFAAELIPAISVATFLALTPRRASVRLAAAAVLSIDLIAFALAQSRGGIVGLAVAFLAAFVLGGNVRPRLMVLIALVVAVAAAYYVEYAPAHVKDRLTSVSAQGSSGRSDEWQIAVRMFDSHPIVGVGLGNYPVVEPSYASQSINLQFVKFVVQDRLVAHNTFLELAAELGVVGLGAFLAILGFALARAVRSLDWLQRERRDLEFYGRGLVVGMVGLLVADFFFSAQYEKQLWLLLGLLAALPSLAAAAADAKA